MPIQTAWKPPSNPKLEQYLNPTKLCNPNHPKIVETAKKLSCCAKNPKEAAINVFYFVRDSIKWYAFPQKLLTAEEVLNCEYGTCYNKATLQIALLRCLNIPARYKHQKIRFELYLRAIPTGKISEFFLSLYPSQVITTFAEVYLNGKWVSASTTFDKQYNPERAKDWDGEKNVSSFKGDEIIEEMGTTAEIYKPDVEEVWKKVEEKKLSKELITMFEEILKLHSDLRRFNLKIEKNLNNLMEKTFKPPKD
ncbi:MAG: hypothetical protein DRO36_04420 [Candidatus Hecatellales archaeon]|mgnify:CR=1 FL=1|nr:MAG: hypothetical protein DRO36_04420 [Candidatus Hecatellales archaeon]